MTERQKKQKITYTASLKGMKKAESALRRLGFDSKYKFAESQLLSRSTVIKFFQYQPTQLNSLKRVCEALTLNWQDIVESSVENEDIKRI